MCCPSANKRRMPPPPRPPPSPLRVSPRPPSPFLISVLVTTGGLWKADESPTVPDSFPLDDNQVVVVVWRDGEDPSPTLPLTALLPPRVSLG